MGTLVDGGLSQLIHALYRGIPETPLVAVIQVYGDDSADHNNRVFAVAGYLAAAEDWDRLSNRWIETLQAGYRPVSEFHMTDCENQGGVFQGWPKSECNALIKNLIDVIVHPSSHLTGVGAAYILGEMDHGIVRAKRGSTTGAYIACFQALIRFSIQELVDLSRDRLEVIFDSQVGVEGLADTMFDKAMDRQLTERVRGSVEHPIFRHRVNSPPLQVADVIAYEVQKHLINKRYSPGIPVRRSMERLMTERKNILRYYDKDFFLRFYHSGLKSWPDTKMPDVWGANP